jgi:2-keto-4-pentenoate hydratase
MALGKEMELLAVAERKRKPVGPISDQVPGGLPLDAAHAICEGNIQRRLDGGEALAGFKVGFTNIAVRDKMGLPDSTYGYLLNSMVLRDGESLDMAQFIEPKIECEICFRLGHDLIGRGLTVEEVLNATAGVSASFEICDSRIKNWKCPYPDFLADNGFAARVALSGRWQSAEGFDFLNEKVVLTQNGRDVAEGTGVLAMGHPAKAVAWLAGKLNERGKGLKAGQIIMTGTLTPILPIEQGSTYVARFSTLGEIRVTFV